MAKTNPYWEALKDMSPIKDIDLRAFHMVDFLMLEAEETGSFLDISYKGVSKKQHKTRKKNQQKAKAKMAAKEINITFYMSIEGFLTTEIPERE